MQKPLYDRRHAIITGAAQATPEEVEAGEQQSIKDDPDYTPLPKDVQPSAAGIPEFWLTALRTHVHLGEIITERDAEALKHLTDIRIEYLPSTEPKPGFKLQFFFSPNEFFENEVLEKTYLYQEEVGYSGDFMYDRAIGTEIKWKEDKDLTKEFEVKKQRNKSESRLASGFRLLAFLIGDRPPLPRRHEPDAAGQESAADGVVLQLLLAPSAALGGGDREQRAGRGRARGARGEARDRLPARRGSQGEGTYMRRVSHMLSSNRGWVQIIPRAIDYFTGKALEYEDFDDDDDFEDIEDDEDDEDEFEDDVCLYLVPLSCWPPLTIGVSLCRIRTRTATCPRGDGGRRRAGALQIRMSTRKSASSSDLIIGLASRIHTNNACSLCIDFEASDLYD